MAKFVGAILHAYVLIFYFNTEKTKKIILEIKKPCQARRHGTAQPTPAQPMAGYAMPGYFPGGPGRAGPPDGVPGTAHLTCIMGRQCKQKTHSPLVGQLLFAF